MSAVLSESELPRVVHGLPNADYHASPGVSKSGLDDIAKSPMHYYGLHIDPSRPNAEESAAQLAGNLAHCSILEPDAFPLRYKVGPDVSRNTKVWKEFEASLPPGVQAIKPDERDKAMRQADSVRRLPDVRDALARGYAETSAYWVDDETGVLCRCRPDWWHTYSGAVSILVDVKTCGDASPREFAAQIARMRYHVQDAFYTEGFSIASRTEVAGFLFVAVEDKWPYAASVCMLDESSKLKGSVLAHRALRTYAECMRSQSWPGYPEAIQSVSLPAWALAASTQGE